MNRVIRAFVLSVVPLAIRLAASRSRNHSIYHFGCTSVHSDVYIRDFLEDVGYPVSAPTPLLIDSKAAIMLAEDPVAFKKTKHITRAAYELRDSCVARRVFVPEYVASEDQLADVLTKALRPGQHVRRP